MPETEYRSPAAETTARVDSFLKRVDETIEGYIEYRRKSSEEQEVGHERS